MTKSYLTNKKILKGEEVKAQDLREGIYQLIVSEFPEFNRDCFISIDELNKYRRLYLTSLISKENKELDIIDKEVMKVIKNNSILSENIEDGIEGKLTLGNRMADKIALFGGSWTFIIAFFLFILVWMAINIWVLYSKPFDPFPFILLNLILSCLAAIQAPLSC